MSVIIRQILSGELFIQLKPYDDLIQKILITIRKKKKKEKKKEKKRKKEKRKKKKRLQSSSTPRKMSSN